MTTQTLQSSTTLETIKVSSNQLVERMKQLIHEGNIRRIVISHEGRVVAEFPLTVGVVGALLAPVLAGVGAMAALLSECTIEVERVNTPSAQPRYADGDDVPVQEIITTQYDDR